jgi:hypothetical protein
MRVHDDIEQGSLDWDWLRAGKVTASALKRLVTPLGKIRTGDGPTTYRREVLAERWLGSPLPSDRGEIWDLQQGHFLEEYARPAFTLETGLKTRQVAFIEDDTGKLGCSPDGLILDNSGVEIKCPHLPNHLAYLLDGVLPEDHVLQVQGSMFVTGFDHWYFCSFRRRLPIFVLKVARDEKIQTAICGAVKAFEESLAEEWSALCQKNGGPPPPPKRPVLSAESRLPEQDPNRGITP